MFSVEESKASSTLSALTSPTNHIRTCRRVQKTISKSRQNSKIKGLKECHAQIFHATVEEGVYGRTETVWEECEDCSARLQSTLLAEIVRSFDEDRKWHDGENSRKKYTNSSYQITLSYPPCIAHAVAEILNDEIFVKKNAIESDAQLESNVPGSMSKDSTTAETYTNQAAAPKRSSIDTDINEDVDMVVNPAKRARTIVTEERTEEKEAFSWNTSNMSTASVDDQMANELLRKFSKLSDKGKMLVTSLADLLGTGPDDLKIKLDRVKVAIEEMYAETVDPVVGDTRDQG
ncbi:hypothetical protein H2198_008284 [Neophaeococcomyces mojaviensis]|uniref:Uncharacterized protein n=1 Tax=Neophaeococcomyces mojaviensis TaxID=3383035 RepID=A0ACC2ZXM1_9EURO|nr:hypothetical protein H2198_008284 [Knufia sp. JES_112]